MCRVVCSVVFVVLRVLDLVGEILWSIISSFYEELSLESRVLDRGSLNPAGFVAVVGW